MDADCGIQEIAVLGSHMDLPVGDLALLIRVDKVVSTPSEVWPPKWVCITKQRCEGQTPKERGAQSGNVTV